MFDDVDVHLLVRWQSIDVSTEEDQDVIQKYSRAGEIDAINQLTKQKPL
ncbi:hypothetical protein [Gimesia aquarii]|nr:hypothetical protein [Gimesia aquarii]